MANSESLLSSVKSALGITGTYHDNLLSIYIEEVISFMQDAGVALSIINSDSSIGCITKGVADLWNNGYSKSELSPYFKMRVIQLANKAVI